MTQTTDYNAKDYERRYQEGYGLDYPESHIVRLNKHVLEWELNLRGGRAFDFGCGAGAHLRYFADCGYEPHGCDTSASAIERCKARLPAFGGNFHVTPVNPDLRGLLAPGALDLFLSNQVLYFLNDAGIRAVVAQAHELLRPGGVFAVTMMAPSCWYARCVVGREGDFSRVRLDTPRQKSELLVNFKAQADLPALFAPFTPLHQGMYGSHIRQEEGATDHWLYVGIKGEKGATR
jgi:SAM-dependent methyltransferase